MSRAYAQTATAIWRPESDFNDLNSSAQRTYWLLYSQEDISAAGVLTLAVDRWAGNARDTTPDSIRSDLKELAGTRYVFVDERTQEILVRTFVKWDRGYNNEKRRPVIVRAALETRSPTLRSVLAEELTRLGVRIEGLASPTRPESPSDGLSTDLPAAGGQHAVADRTESEYSQFEGLSDSAYDAGPTSEGVVVTKALEVDPPTHNPQSPTPANVRAVADRIRALRPAWSVPTVENAIRNSLAAGRTLEHIAVVFPVVADDPNTRSPGRLNAPGPWWDAVPQRFVADDLPASLRHEFKPNTPDSRICARCDLPKPNRRHTLAVEGRAA